MITIPTSELLGLVTDVIGFAPASKDNPDAGILIHWDGEELHMSAHDVLSGGRATWIPGEGDENDADESDETPATWGGDDEPWKVFIAADDAREIVKTFKLPVKQRLTPLLVKHLGGYSAGSGLVIERQKDLNRSGHMAMFAGDYERAVKFPDVLSIAKDAWGSTSPVGRESFSPSRLAAFGAVRAYGPMEITFGRQGQPSSVYIGDRFVGFIYSTRPEAVAAGRNRNHLTGLTDVGGVRVEVGPPIGNDSDNE